MRTGLAITAVSLGAAVLAACGGGAANNMQKAGPPAALAPGRYEVTAEVTAFRQADEGTPRVTATQGQRTTRNVCVAAGANAPVALFADEGYECQEGSSYYVRGGLVNVALRCTRQGWTGGVLFTAQGSFEAQSFTATRVMTTQLSGTGDVVVNSSLTARRAAHTNQPCPTRRPSAMMGRCSPLPALTCRPPAGAVGGGDNKGSVAWTLWTLDGCAAPRIT